MTVAASPALRDAAVRDLAWLLSSADLLKTTPRAPLARPWSSGTDAAWAAAWLAELDAQPDALHRMLAAAKLTRLGRYAETLLAFFVDAAPSLRLVAANLPLRNNGRTLGECDLLLETASGQRLHWELAVKYYLCVASQPSAVLTDFVGPNLADRFDLKRARLIEHQLRLTERAEFATLGLPGPWDARMFMKGWLFYPAASDIAAPPEVDAAHSRGFWVTRAGWRAFAAQQSQAARQLQTAEQSQTVQQPQTIGWLMLPRLAWLAPRRIDEEVAASGPFRPMTADALFDEVARHPNPSLVAALVQDSAGTWCEISRGFIVPDDWPERARAFAAG